MKHFPSRHNPVHIDSDRLAHDIIRDTRRMFWFGVLQSLLCAALGALAGLAYGLGYLADLPAALK